ALASDPEMAGVWIAGRHRERVHHPREAAVLADDDVGILVVDEERRERLGAGADVAPHQQAALGGDVVTERQLGQIAAVEGDDQAPEEAAELDAAAALVGRQGGGLALRVVELL